MSIIIEGEKKVNLLSTYCVTHISDNNHSTCVYMCSLLLKEMAEQRIPAEFPNVPIFRPSFLQGGEAATGALFQGLGKMTSMWEAPDQLYFCH